MPDARWFVETPIGIILLGATGSILATLLLALTRWIFNRLTSLTQLFFVTRAAGALNFLISPIAKRAENHAYHLGRMSMGSDPYGTVVFLAYHLLWAMVSGLFALIAIGFSILLLTSPLAKGFPIGAIGWLAIGLALMYRAIDHAFAVSVPYAFFDAIRNTVIEFRHGQIDAK